jgi:hypothetical protein
MKYCKDCKYARPDNGELWFAIIPFLWPAILRSRWEFAKCARAPRHKENCVTPNARKYHFCSTERAGDCGLEGKYWKARR